MITPAFDISDSIYSFSENDINYDNNSNEVSRLINNPATSATVADCFYKWEETFPELQILLDNIPIILEDSLRIKQWVPWPEDHFALTYGADNTNDWTVFPLLHTFPAYVERNQSWVTSTCSLCSKTAELLRSIPNIRTALFSKLGPGTKLSSHTGWADLANYVLRAHICLDIPTDPENCCGLLVDGEVQYHAPGKIIVFDDSKPHRAFNHSEDQARTVLIVDILRPSYVPFGRATGNHTSELDNFVSKFK
eukprot:gene5860-8084_t